jgi:D-arabinose 1-dehydrogenase-like Zn-dependent alcohol dehydrogenase
MGVKIAKARGCVVTVISTSAKKRDFAVACGRVQAAMSEHVRPSCIDCKDILPRGEIILIIHVTIDPYLLNRPISVHRLGEMPIQSCGQESAHGADKRAPG